MPMPTGRPFEGMQPLRRRAILRGASLAAGAAFAGPFARFAGAGSVKKPDVVPALAFFPTPYRREVNLQGKNVVITGASRGMGRAIALELLNAGATVWGTSRTPLAYPGVTEYPLLALDIADPVSIGAFVPAIGATTAGRVDVLINNAGRYVLGSTTPLGPESGLHEHRSRGGAATDLHRAGRRQRRSESGVAVGIRPAADSRRWRHRPAAVDRRPCAPSASGDAVTAVQHDARGVRRTARRRGADPAVLDRRTEGDERRRPALGQAVKRHRHR
jgi:short chain dehydrogenase